MSLSKISFFGAFIIFIALFITGCGEKVEVKTEPTPIIQEIQIIQPEERSITVTGEGKVELEPNVMEFVVRIENAHKELATAKDENEKIKQTIVAVLENYSIDQGDIQNDFIRIKTDATSSKVYRYIVTNSIKVNLRNLSKMDKLLTDILEAGAYEITDITFHVTNLEQYEERVTKLALQSAKEKASVMASELGQEIGKPISIEQSSTTDGYSNQYRQTYTLEGLELDYVFDDLNAIAFGKLTIKTFVTVKFELK